MSCPFNSPHAPFTTFPTYDVFFFSYYCLHACMNACIDTTYWIYLVGCLCVHYFRAENLIVYDQWGVHSWEKWILSQRSWTACSSFSRNWFLWDFPLLCYHVHCYLGLIQASVLLQYHGYSFPFVFSTRNLEADFLSLWLLQSFHTSLQIFPEP